MSSCFHRATYILMPMTGEETILTGSICQDQDLPLDDKLLTWFGVPDDPAKQVCSVLKSQYAHGNTYVRMGIGALVHGMLSILQERHNLKQESQKATHELRHAEELCRELQESNEALRHAQDATASLEVCVPCFLVRYLSTDIESAQTKLRASEQSYTEYYETTKEQISTLGENLDKMTSKFEAAQSKLVALESRTSQLAEHNKRLQNIDAILKQSDTFPVIQTNGRVTDFHVIMNIWQRQADEDDNTHLRVFECPVTGCSTRLAQYPIIAQIHQMATAVGVRLEAPVVFETKNEGYGWNQLSTKSQIQLSARLCFVYANRKRYQRSGDKNSMTTDDEQMLVTFHIEEVMPNLPMIPRFALLTSRFRSQMATRFFIARASRKERRKKRPSACASRVRGGIHSLRWSLQIRYSSSRIEIRCVIDERPRCEEIGRAFCHASQ